MTESTRRRPRAQRGIKVRIGEIVKVWRNWYLSPRLRKLTHITSWLVVLALLALLLVIQVIDLPEGDSTFISDVEAGVQANSVYIGYRTFDDFRDVRFSSPPALTLTPTSDGWKGGFSMEIGQARNLGQAGSVMLYLPAVEDPVISEVSGYDVSRAHIGNHHLYQIEVDTSRLPKDDAETFYILFDNGWVDPYIQHLGIGTTRRLLYLSQQGLLEADGIPIARAQNARIEDLGFSGLEATVQIGPEKSSLLMTQTVPEPVADRIDRAVYRMPEVPDGAGPVLVGFEDIESRYWVEVASQALFTLLGLVLGIFLARPSIFRARKKPPALGSGSSTFVGDSS